MKRATARCDGAESPSPPGDVLFLLHRGNSPTVTGFLYLLKNNTSYFFKKNPFIVTLNVVEGP